MASIMSQLVARLTLARMTHAGVYIARGGAAESVGGGGLGRFFAVGALGEVVVGLAGNFGGAIGGEGAILGRGARGKGFGVEFRDGVIAYENTGLVLLIGKISSGFESWVEK